MTRDGEPVAIASRDGHAVDDPAGLSEDSTRLLCTVRDGTCRMPGCHRPVRATDLHHLVWRALARARGETAPDDPRHRASLCRRCHRLTHRWRWAGTVGALGRLTWTHTASDGRHLTAATTGRLTHRMPRPPPPKIDSDLDSEPLPF